MKRQRARQSNILTVDFTGDRDWHLFTLRFSVRELRFLLPSSSYGLKMNNNGMDGYREAYVRAGYNTVD